MMVSDERGFEQVIPIEQEAGRTSLAPEASKESQTVPPDQRQQLKEDTPCHATPEAQREDGGITRTLRYEAYVLSFELEQLRSRLRRRTVVLGSCLALVTSVTSVLLFSLNSLVHPPEVEATAQARQRVMEAPNAADIPKPVVQLPPPEQIPAGKREAKPSLVMLVAQENPRAPVMLRPGPTDRQPVPPAEIQALPSLPTGDPANDFATTSKLRVLLYGIKQQMRGPLRVSDPQADDSVSLDRVEARQPPFVALTSREPTSEVLAVPRAIRDLPSVPAAPTTTPTLLSGAQR
jgi:hypothetical protein